MIRILVCWITPARLVIAPCFVCPRAVRFVRGLAKPRAALFRLSGSGGSSGTRMTVALAVREEPAVRVALMGITAAVFASAPGSPTATSPVKVPTAARASAPSRPVRSGRGAPAMSDVGGMLTFPPPLVKVSTGAFSAAGGSCTPDEKNRLPGGGISLPSVSQPHGTGASVEAGAGVASAAGWGASAVGGGGSEDGSVGNRLFRATDRYAARRLSASLLRNGGFLTRISHHARNQLRQRNP
jgi:hypothetical protein